MIPTDIGFIVFVAIYLSIKWYLRRKKVHKRGYFLRLCLKITLKF